MSLAAGSRIGPYEVISTLGVGGMGEVYRARDLRLQRDIALKVLPDTAALDPDRRDRFEHEAQAVAALNHPNIVTIYSVEQSDGRLFLTMEVVEGRPLAEEIPAGGLAIDRLVSIGIAVADALGAAHQKGITHRDLKPGNIMIGKGEHHGRIKVLDFGLAKLATLSGKSTGVTLMPTAPLTAEGSIVGTVAYMSPEQVERQPVDSRSDLFALGIILYEMATGKRPFAGGTSVSIMASILRDTPAPVTELNPAAPYDLSRIVRRALAKDPERRYQSAKDLRNDLEELKNALASGEHVAFSTSSAGDAAASPQNPTHLPVPPPVSSVSQMAVALVKRHRGALVGAAAAVGVALVGVMYSIGQRQQAPAPQSAAARRPSPALQDLRITQLTTSGNAERPAISPDGKYVAYVQREGQEDSLWIRQTTTSGNVQIVGPVKGDRLIGVTVSPDGNFIDFVRGRERQFALWRVPFLGGSPKRLFSDVHTPVGWSPDGAHLAFLRRDQAGGSSSLIVADADWSHERALTVRRDPELFAPILGAGFPGPRPAWSPDGRIIAVPGIDQRSGSRVHQVLFVEFPSGSIRTISLPKPSDGAGLGMEWLNGDSLVLTTASDTGSPSQLWRLSFPEGRLFRVTNDVNRYLRVSLTADRTSLVTVRSDVHGSLWMSNGSAENGVDAVPAATTVMAAGGIAWTADGLLYVTTTNGPPAIVRIVDGDAPEELVSGASDPAVAPDDRTIVFSSEVRTEPGLWKASLDGRERIKLADGFSPVVTPDGQSVLFISFTGGLQSPWIVPLDGRAPQQIAKLYAGTMSLAVSPDGRSLAFWSQDEQNKRVLRSCALPTCEGPTTLRVPPSQRRIRYTPDGRTIAYLDPTGTNIWLLPVAGGSPRQLTHFRDDRTIGDFAWSRDGKRLAIARFTVANDIVLFRGLGE